MNNIRFTMYRLILGLILLSMATSNFAQTTNDVLNLLIKNKTISQGQADSVRAEAATKQKEQDVNKTTFFATTGRPFQMTGYTQVRYQFRQQEGKIDGFDIRRARLDFQGNANSWFSYRLLTDFATPKILLDAFGDIKLRDYLILTIGQARIPFSLENQIADRQLEIPDRSQVVEALVARSTDVIGNQNGRDIGLQARGSLLKYASRYLVEYQIGVFNGAGIDVVANNNNKDLSGRLIIHPSDQLSVGGSFYSGTGFYGTLTPANHVRSRTGMELNYNYQRFFVRSEYIAGKDGAISRNGWYCETGYFLIPEQLQLILRYDTYDPNVKVSKDATGDYLVGGTYHFNSWSKIQAAFTLIKNEAGGGTNNMGTIQYQITF